MWDLFICWFIGSFYFSQEVWPSRYKWPITLCVSVVSEILPSSSCVKILSLIRCSCDSQGNPRPSLVWELAGEPVNHSAEIPIREVPLGSAGMRSLITLYRLDEDMPSLVCLSVNSLGSDRFVFNVSSSETQLGRGIYRMLHLCQTFLLYHMPLSGFSDWYGLCELFRPPYGVSFDRLCSGSTGDAAGVCPTLTILLQVRHTAETTPAANALNTALLPGHFGFKMRQKHIMRLTGDQAGSQFQWEGLIISDCTYNSDFYVDCRKKKGSHSPDKGLVDTSDILVTNEVSLCPCTHDHVYVMIILSVIAVCVDRNSSGWV